MKERRNRALKTRCKRPHKGVLVKRSSNEARLANVGAQKGFTREGAMNGQVPKKKKTKKRIVRDK